MSTARSEQELRFDTDGAILHDGVSCAFNLPRSACVHGDAVVVGADATIRAGPKPTHGLNDFMTRKLNKAVLRNDVVSQGLK